MLSRSIRQGARCYSTAVKSEVSGVKVVSRDVESPVSQVAVVVKAGSRYSQPGVAHLLKNFAFHTSSSTKSGLRRHRESELVGGNFKATLSREHLILEANFLRNALPFFVENVADVLTNQVYKPHEFSEHVLPQSINEANAAAQSTEFVALENAFQVAYRNGLGNPLYVQNYSPVSLEQVSSYGQDVYNKSNIAIFANGVETKDFSDLVEKHFKKLHSGSELSGAATKVHGGESRVASANGNSIVIAFPSVKNSKVVANLLGNGSPSVKWSVGQSPLAIASLKSGATVNASSEVFSDAEFLYVTVSGATPAIARAGAQEATKAIKELAQVGDEQVTRAIAQTKFSEAAFADKCNIYSLTGSQLTTFDTASVKKVAAELTKQPIVYSVVGNIQELPYFDELF